MRHIKLVDLQKELNEKGIPQFCAELKRKHGYDAVARKRRLNPKEQEIIDTIKQNSSISNTE